MVCKLQIYYATKARSDRANEDNFMVDKYIPGCSKIPFFSGHMECVLNENMIFAVSDGAGGGYNASEAAKITIDTISENLTSVKTLSPDKALGKILDLANSKVVSYYDQVQNIGAATLSGIILDKETAWLFNIGDSPIYSLEHGKLQKVSRDHTLAATGLVEDSHARNTLVYFMGNTAMSGTEMAFSSNIPINSPITFIIASDGVLKGLNEKQLAKLADKRGNSLAEDIVNLAFKRGSRDDITAIIIKVITQKTEDK